MSATDKTPASPIPTCSTCRRERTVQDVNDYHPLQVLSCAPLGWYTGDDGEVCPECMTRFIRGGRG